MNTRILLFLLLTGALSAQTRVNVGGPQYIDSSGFTWNADTGCTSTSSYSRGGVIHGTNDSTLYQTGRTDPRQVNCMYTVASPLFYTVTLLFAETDPQVTSTSQSGGQPRVMNVYINGQLYWAQLNVQASSAFRTAYSVTSPYIAVSTGEIDIQVIQLAYQAMLSGIDIEPVLALSSSSVNVSQFSILPNNVDSTTSINALLSTYHNTQFYFPPSTTTSCYRVSTIILQAGSGIIGSGDQTCFISATTGDVIKNAPNTSHFALKDFSIQTTTASNGIHFNGAIGLNATNTEISGIGFSPNNTSIYSNAEILLEDTYLIHVVNNNFDALSPYGVKMSSTFNNTNTIELNTFAATSQAGIYCNNSCTGMTIIDNVLQANGRKAIWIDGGNPSGVFDIRGNHTELNQATAADYDVVIAPSTLTYNGAWGSTTITGNSLQPGNSALGAIYVAYQQGVVIEQNRCYSQTGVANRIHLGPAVINSRIGPNPACALVGDSGLAINDSTTPVSYSNLFKSSVALDNSVVGAYWSPSTSVDQAGTPLFDDGTPAWNLNITTTASISGNTFGYSPTVSPTGRFFSCGVWAKTNSGTATGFTSIYNSFATYTGSLGTVVFSLGATRWKWISASVTTDATDASVFIGCSFTFTASGATTIQLAKPMLCVDTLNCAYVPTTTAPVSKASNPTGHTVFLQLPAASAAQPPIICDDCTVANPTAGSGAGALVVPIGGVNIGK